MGAANYLDAGHAFCVLAHADEEMFHRLTQRLLRVGPVYAHIDSKTDMSSWRSNNHGVEFVENPVDVYWGDWSIIEATISVVRLALSNSEVRRVTLVTGSHYPLISEAELALKGRLPGHIIRVRPAPDKGIGKSDHQYRTRFVRSRHPNTLRHQVVSAFVNRVLWRNNRIEWEHYVNPALMRAGSQFWSVERQVAFYFLEKFEEGGPLVEYFKMIVCADEKFFHTIFAEIDPSIHAEGTTYARWLGSHHPLRLTQEDLEFAIEMDTFWFARKFDSTRDRKLLEWLDSGTR